MDYRSQSSQMTGMWERTQGLRRAFLLGLVIGVLIGWFFSGLVSLLVSAGAFLLLLIPVAIIAWIWWRLRSQRSRPEEQRSGQTVMTWSTRQFPGQRSWPYDDSRNAHEPNEMDENVYDLDELKRQMERER